MEYVAMIGLLFAPIVCLLCAAWFYVRWQNEHEDQALAQRDRRTCFIFLIKASVSVSSFISNNMSMVGLAINPFTAVLPMCRMRNMLSPTKVRSCSSSCIYKSFQFS